MDSTPSSYWERMRGRRISRRAALRTGGLTSIGLSAAALLACSSSNNNSGSNASGAAKPAAPAASAALAASPASPGASPAASTAATAGAVGSPAAAQIKRGGKLTIVYSAGEQGNEDPHQYSGGDLFVHGSGVVYNRLLRYKLGPDVADIDLIPSPDTADSWEQPDDTTYVFHVHPGIKFHDVAPVNGRVLTAQDFVYSYGRQKDLKINAANIPGISALTAVDPTTLKIQLGAPDVDFLVALSAMTNVVVAHEAVDLKGDLKDGPNIGTGAWIFKNWVPRSTIQFSSNPNYFRIAPDGKPFPYMSEVEILRIIDASTVLAAFRTKKIDMHAPAIPDIKQLKSDFPELVWRDGKISGPTSGYSVVMLANTAPTNDPRVRQAVNLGIDRHNVIDTITLGTAWRGGTLLSVSSSAQLIGDDEIDQLQPFDPQKAQQLLSAAGATNWKPKLTNFGASTASATTGELVQSQLKKIGIDSTLDVPDINAFVKWLQLQDDGKELVAFLRGVYVFSPNADLQASYKTGGGRNVARISDPQLDSMIDAQAKELKDAAKRANMIKDIERAIIANGACVPLYTTNYITTRWPYVHDVYQPFGITSENAFMEYMWLSK